MPMQSTGGEKFTAYTYFKTELYKPNDPWSESDSDSASDESDEAEDDQSSEEETKAISVGKKRSKSNEPTPVATKRRRKA